jgi:hypothetical protein
VEQGWGALRGGAQEYTILYPLLIAPAFALDSRSEAHQAALAINAIVSSSALLPLYWIARRMLPPSVSAGLVALLAILPPVFVYALALSSENLFLPLFWWGTFLLLRLAERDRSTDAAAAGLVIGLLPLVKLTGFAIFAAAAVLAVGMAIFRRVRGDRAAALLCALFAPQVAWVLLRALLGGPERGLFGLGPEVGGALVTGLARLHHEGWRPFVSFFLGETTYFLVGAYIAWLAFSAYLVTQYRTWRSRSVEGFLLLWTFLAAVSLALVTILLLFPIAQSLTDPVQRARPIYGRFIEVLFPAFFLLGTRGMMDFAWKEQPADRSATGRRREVILVLLTAVFMAMSLYPLTRYAVSSPFRGYVLGESRLAAVVLLLVLLLPCVAASAWLLWRAGHARRRALAVAISAAIAVHALVSAVAIGGVVRGARIRDGTLFRIGRWLERGAGRETLVGYDGGMGFGDQYFAYRFWSDAQWRVLLPDEMTPNGPIGGDLDYVVTRRPLTLPVVTQEANGVRLYRSIRSRGRPSAAGAGDPGGRSARPRISLSRAPTQPVVLAG